METEEDFLIAMDGTTDNEGKYEYRLYRSGRLVGLFKSKYYFKHCYKKANLKSQIQL